MQTLELLERDTTVPVQIHLLSILFRERGEPFQNDLSKSVSLEKGLLIFCHSSFGVPFRAGPATLAGARRSGKRQ